MLIIQERDYIHDLTNDIFIIKYPFEIVENKNGWAFIPTAADRDSPPLIPKLSKFGFASAARRFAAQEAVMGAPVAVTRMTHTSAELRALAAKTDDADQARRLLAIAMVLDGTSRLDAARQTGMDRQTLRDWVHRDTRPSMPVVL